MNTEIGTPWIHRFLIVLLLPSSSMNTGSSVEHVPLRALSFMPSFAKFPILNSADARNSGRNNSVRAQKMSCMFSSVAGKPFFHFKSEQPAHVKIKMLLYYYYAALFIKFILSTLIKGLFATTTHMHLIENLCRLMCGDIFQTSTRSIKITIELIYFQNNETDSNECERINLFENKYNLPEKGL